MALMWIIVFSSIAVGAISAETGCIDEQFIKDKEGFRTEGYVPQEDGVVLGHSGVTIGNGIDLGTKNRQYFENLGVSSAVIDKLEPYFGLQKQDAVDKLAELPLSLTGDEATELSAKVMAHATAAVKSQYDNAIDDTKKTWDELTDAQRTVIASVLFQYGSPTRTPTFWRHCKNQDWDSVEAELRNFGDKYTSRRLLEADLLRDDDGSNCGVLPSTIPPPTTTTAAIIQGETCSTVERVLRADWGARAAKKTLPSLRSKVSLVFIHHTTGGSCTTKSVCIEKARHHQSYHMDTRGWSDIGYNYLVAEDGRAYEGRGLNKVGGHTYGYNSKAIAISVIGDFTQRNPDAAALNAIKAIINCAIDEGVVDADYKLYGHRDAGCTECPGNELYKEIQTWPKYSTQPIQKWCNKKPWTGGTSSTETPTPPTTGNTDSSAGVCGTYGDIRNLKPKGASAKTSKQDNLSTKGITASNTLMDTDFTELDKHKTCFYQVGRDLGIHPALIAGIASRESRGGSLLDNQGYGDNGKAYGIMQCDIENSGLDCTKYGAKSCEHIRMLVEERLIPDISAVQKKQKAWPIERQLQGAVAAYNFGVSNVQTWSGLDRGSTNDDYSHDIIARSQRLIAHYGWTCDASSSGSNQPSPTPPPSPPSAGPVGTCQQMANAGNCTFYRHCIENEVSCGEEGYALGYAYKYCNKFGEFYHQFDTTGKEWVNSVRSCLMNTILPHSRKPGITCDRLLEIAFNSHVRCYIDSGEGICEVAKSLTNLNALWNVYEFKDFFGRHWRRAWAQVLHTVHDCGVSEVQSWYDSAKGKLEDTVDAITDWFEDNIGRKKRSLESDCEDYANAGDCQFYECFEKKFPCADTFGYSHVMDFELTHCMEFDKMSLSDREVADWYKSSQKCLMEHLRPLYDQPSVKCASLEVHMYEARVDCMVDEGFCPLKLANEWIIDRGTNTFGYPFLQPRLYTTRPIDGTTHMMDESYFSVLQDLKSQIGQANAKCAKKGEREFSSLYEIKETQFGPLKIRTEF